MQKRGCPGTRDARSVFALHLLASFRAPLSACGVGCRKPRDLRGFGQPGCRKPRFFAWFWAAGMPKTMLRICVVVDRWDAQNRVMALHCLRVASVALKWKRRAQKIPSGATKVRVKTEPCCQTPFPRRILAFHRAPPDIPY